MGYMSRKMRKMATLNVVMNKNHIPWGWNET